MNTEQEISLLRNRVAHLEGQVAFLYRHLGVAFTPESAPGDDPRIIEAIKKGNLLGAIKVYRELHSTGSVSISVDEARAAVEEIQGRLGI